MASLANIFRRLMYILGREKTLIHVKEGPMWDRIWRENKHDYNYLNNDSGRWNEQKSHSRGIHKAEPS